MLYKYASRSSSNANLFLSAEKPYKMKKIDGTKYRPNISQGTYYKNMLKVWRYHQ